jgi:hypothetical protein
MGRATQRRESAGLTLVELLVVLGMIGVISAVVVPIAIRNGWSTASKTAFAARELFTILKAARVYASTYNVETAVAYGGVLVEDSELKRDPSINRIVPVADSVVLARRLKREELIFYGLGANNTDIFVPLRSEEGVYRKLPKEMVVLPDLFETTGAAPIESTRGLEPVRVYDVDGGVYFQPRADYALPGAAPSSFPAHRFLADGSMRAPEGVQRFRFRVGARPDAAYKDRFHSNSETDALRAETLPVIFDADYATTPMEMLLVFDGGPAANSSPDIATSIELFAPTGRVKLAP